MATSRGLTQAPALELKPLRALGLATPKTGEFHRSPAIAEVIKAERINGIRQEGVRSASLPIDR